MMDESKGAFDYLESARKSGRSVTSKELRSKFQQKDIDAALKMQGKKLTPGAYPPDTDADKDEEIMQSQSTMRKKFMGAKGYK